MINSAITYKDTRLLLVEMVLLVEVVSQVPRVQIVHQQVQVFSVLEREFHVDNEHVIIRLQFA